MNLRQLEIFKAVCEETSFSKAAEKLHVTQPAVSQAVALLEAEAGSPLLERIGKKVSVTESGRLFALKVSELIEKYKEAENVLHGKKNQTNRTVGMLHHDREHVFARRYEALYRFVSRRFAGSRN